ncbi:hypothetical protein CDAR_43771 [Caerostris darwini]|uniref:Uncharacterized protein n=1 Tax=Caerostris darwini TaxID=1538125 RepID=A0AAV4WIU9_9ARAC|nr:hypothetical protein CDAR_43771 [Caerostris darwini]
MLIDAKKRHRTYTTQSQREINCIASHAEQGVFEQSGLAPRTERHGSSLLHPHLRSPKRYISIFSSCRYACEKIANAAPSPEHWETTLSRCSERREYGALLDQRRRAYGRRPVAGTRVFLY